MANIEVSAAIDNLLKSTPSTTVTTVAALKVLGATTAGDASIIAADLATGAVTEAKILDSAVTVNKIGALAVTDAKLAANAVTTAKILDANVTLAKITGLGTAATSAISDIVTSPITGTNNNFVFAGDSITTDANGGAGWPFHLMTLPMFSGKGTKINTAVESRTLANINSAYAAEVYPYRPAATGKPAYLFVLSGANDPTTDSATWLAMLESYWATAKADGFTVIAMTILPNRNIYTSEVKRQEKNKGIRDSDTWDYLVDASSVLQDKNDAALYSDALHPTSRGGRIIADEVQSSLSVRRRSTILDATAITAITGPLMIGTSGISANTTHMAVSKTFALTTGTNEVMANFFVDNAPIANIGNTKIPVQVSYEKTGSFNSDYNTASFFAATIKGAGSAFETHIIDMQGQTQSTSNMTNFNFINIRAFSRTSSGNCSNVVGLNIAAQKVTGVTNAWGIKQAGASDINVFAGNTTFGSTTAPNANAALDVQSTTKAFIPPRMTKVQRDAIASPTAGMVVYQNDNTPGLRTYNGTNWMRYTELAD